MKESVKYTVREIKDAHTRLTDYLVKANSQRKPFLFVPVADSGLMLFGGLCAEFDKRSLVYDYQTISFRSYSGLTRGLIFEKEFQGVWENYFVALLDGVFDIGITSMVVFDHLLNKKHGFTNTFFRGVFLINKCFNDMHFRVGNVKCCSAFAATNKCNLLGCGLDVNLKRRGERAVWSTEIE